MTRVGKRIGCVAIISAAAVSAGLSVHHDLQFVSADLTPASIARQTAEFRQQECISQAIRHMVPKGVTVYVNAPRFQPTQQLSEQGTLWDVPDADLASAQYRLALVPARGHNIVPWPPLTDTPLVPARGQCGGVTLEVRRL